MSQSDLQLAKKYLLPPWSHEVYWDWEDGGDAVSWLEWGTLAFRAELVSVLRHFAPGGLPPLESVLLLLAASRDHWINEEILTNAPLSNSESHYSESDLLYHQLFLQRRGLARISKLDPELRTSLEAKATLAEVVLEWMPRWTTPDEAQIVLRYLESGMAEVLDGYHIQDPSPNRGQDLSPALLQELCVGLERATPEVLRNRRQTSLDQLPQAIDIDLPQSQQARALLTNLRDDDELQGLAKLARDLMAAVSLPRALADQEEMQIGGVSDITNRGPLDRLLLTELVHDDLTLAVRVSVNEALYLRRESPPRTPQKERIVLLDSGIRSWGVPRVFATAVALALTATTGANTQIAVFRADGEKVEPVNLLTREGLIEHLQHLDAAPHPGKAIPALIDAFQLLESAAEPVIVVAEEVLSDPEFQQALSAAAFPSVHLATVSRTGRFCLIEKNLRGSKRVREAELNVEQLFADRLSAPLIDRSQANDLPVIFAKQSFPLRISHQVDYQQAISLGDDGLLSITNQGCLFYWDERRLAGARLLHDQLPSGRLQWSKYDAPQYIAYGVLQQQGRRELAVLKVDLKNLVTETSLVEPRSKGSVIALRDGVLLVLSPNQTHLEALSLQTGESLDVLRLQDEHWTHGRFFRSKRARESWFAASFDGSRLRIDSLVHSAHGKKYEFVGFAEYHGLNAPYGVTRNGMIYYSDTLEVWPIWREGHLVQGAPRFSQDGGRMLLYLQLEKKSSESPCCLIDLEPRAQYRIAPPDPAKVFPTLHSEATRFVTSRNMRHRFTHIAVDRQKGFDRLALISRKNVALVLEIRPDGRPLLLSEKKTEALTLENTFKEVETRRYRFSLGCATWRDGSQAFLDARGMLHLRSSNHSLPEFSLTLTDGENSGWTSDGRLWGASCFTGQESPSTSEGAALADLIRQFMGNLR